MVKLAHPVVQRKNCKFTQGSTPLYYKVSAVQNGA